MPASCAIAVTRSMTACRLLGTAELARVRLGDRHRRTRRRRGVELERAVHDVDLQLAVELGDRPLEPTFADVAPRADDVGPDLDAHASRYVTMSPMRATRRQPRSGQQLRRLLSWPGNATGHRITLRLVSSSAMSAAATFCATLVDEWVRLGVRHAVVAPGSRSTPMAVALASNHDLTVHVVHDERVAAFVALGIGLDGVARGVAVHERHGGGQLPPCRRRGRAVGRPDAGGHVGPTAGTARRRRPADDRSDPPVRPIGPLVPRSRGSRRRRCCRRGGRSAFRA